jgi:hypothetical protein
LDNEWNWNLKAEGNQDMDIGANYLEEITRSLRGHKRMAEAAIAQLSDEQLFATLDPESNSIALLVKHIAGNARSRFTDFLTSDGEKPDRKRDQEFVIDPKSTTRAEIMRWWEEGWSIVFNAVGALTPADLPREVSIRQEPMTVLQALQRAMGHYAQHIGQIVFLAKHLKGKDWKTLSVPRGQSEQFNAEMIQKLKERNKA